MSWIISCTLITYFISLISCDCGSSLKTSIDSYDVDSLIYNGSIKECGCTSENICVRKCCASNYILSNDTCVFKNTNNYLNNLTFYKNADVMDKNSFSVRFVPGQMNCSVIVNLFPDLNPEDNGNIQSDGRLYLRKLNIFFEHKDYCVDYSEEYGLIYYACLDSGGLTVQERISFIGTLISLPFFLVTFIVYALLPERNLHAMCLMSHVFAIFVAYLLVGCVYLSDGEWSMIAYRALFMTVLCCFMASIFWVNVMAFEISSAFRGARSHSMNKKRDERKRFMIANIYAWGISLLFVALILIISKVAKPNAWYDPGFRGYQCVITDGVPMLLYYYGPLAILIISNIVMFIITACKIRKAQKDTAMLTRSGSKKHGSKDDNKQMFQLYIRLLFTMGLNWSMEIINWFVDWQVPNVPPAVWYLTDIFNALYGIIVFILFVCKKSIWKALKKRYYKVMGKHQADITTTGMTSLTE